MTQFTFTRQEQTHPYMHTLPCNAIFTVLSRPMRVWQSLPHQAEVILHLHLLKLFRDTLYSHSAGGPTPAGLAYLLIYSLWAFTFPMLFFLLRLPLNKTECWRWLIEKKKDIAMPFNTQHGPLVYLLELHKGWKCRVLLALLAQHPLFTVHLRVVISPLVIY